MMEILFIAQIVLHLLGAASGFVLVRYQDAARRLTHGLAVLAGLAGMVYSTPVLLGGAGWTLRVPTQLPFGDCVFTLDPLAAFFVFVISFLSTAASIFAIGYTREYQDKKRIPLLGFFYHLFIAAMILVVTVGNAFYFLVAWELMSLGSYFLVVFEHEKPEARRAGLIYFVMTHAGTALIAAAFWLLASASGSFSFEAFRQHAPELTSGIQSAVFLAAIIGFGTKAGMIPLHVWLPEAHPQAPSHVSALMSGVMIKTAIYALLRFLFTFLGDIPAWWGFLVLALAILSALLGVLYALMEHDLKRLLAYHSIENIGIILLGVGMALVFAHTGQPLFASFSLIAALYHTLNHACFKGLLFLGSGAVLSQTHTRNMEELGGLIKKMPQTAFSFLIGAAAISALPPLNGFVSEWLTFISLLLGFEIPGVGIRFFAPVLASLLGLAGALAAACFVKAFGITFLGMARSAHAEKAREVDASMRFAMGLLVAGCFAFALGAPWIVSILGKVSSVLVGMEIPKEMFAEKVFLLTPSELSRISPLAAGLVFLVLAPGTFVIVHLVLRKPRIRLGPSWDCGMPRLVPRMQYTATGYSKPIRRIFSFLYQPARNVEVEDEGLEILRTAQKFETGVRPLFEEIFYQPAYRLVAWIAGKVRQIQTGHIQLYLAYIFVTLILLLILARLS